MWNMWHMSRRTLVSGIASLGCFLAVSGIFWSTAPKAQAPKPEETFASVTVDADDKVLGRADAPVTIVEYASFTCPHCAHFHADILPELKKAYIETGKARLVYRDFPLDRYALAASVVARCAAGNRYFGFVDLLYREQPRWSSAKNPVAALGGLAMLAGISRKKLETCLGDEGVHKAVLQQHLTASQKYKVSSTPTLIVNGAKYGGGLTLEQLRAVVDAILSGS